MIYQWKFLTIRDLCKADLDFLFVCTLTTMPFRFLNPCNHLSLALKFFFWSSDSEGSSRTNFSIFALRYLPSQLMSHLKKMRNTMMSFLRLLKLIYSLLKRRSSRKNLRRNARRTKMLLFAYEQKDVQETSLDITVNTPSQSIFAKFKAVSWHGFLNSFNKILSFFEEGSLQWYMVM